MTDSSTVDPVSESTQRNIATNANGEIDFHAKQVDVGGDVVGGNKSETTNIYLTLDAAPVPGSATSATVGKGLLALRELMQHSSDVRTDGIAFQTDFRAAREQIVRLSDYKKLHDLLHRLQFYCYNDMAQAALRFPKENAIYDLTYYALTLGDIVAELRRVAARSTLPREETSWVDDVAAAKVDLNAALDRRDEELLKRVIWCLKRVLDTQPSLINKLLNHTASVLRLSSLTEALARFCNGFSSLDLDAGKVQQFEEGVAGLRQLDQGVIALTDEHNRWQKLDLELRLIAATLDGGRFRRSKRIPKVDFSDLVMSWPDVKARAEQLCLNTADEWAQDLQKESRGLDDALAAGNPKMIMLSFRGFQRRVADRFFQVDVDLKALCDDLRQIGAPLALVLEMFQ